MFLTKLQQEKTEGTNGYGNQYSKRSQVPDGWQTVAQRLSGARRGLDENKWNLNGDGEGSQHLNEARRGFFRTLMRMKSLIYFFHIIEKMKYYNITAQSCSAGRD